MLSQYLGATLIDLQFSGFTEEQTVSGPIQIETLIPQPLPDLRRVSLILRVSGLPAYGHSNVSNPIHFYDMPQLTESTPGGKSTQSPSTANPSLFPDAGPPQEAPVDNHPTLSDDRPPSPYPDVTLSILDQHGHEIATTFIVEHKEPELDFTLHLRTFESGATYIARAEMTRNDEVLQTVQVPFELR